MTSVCDKKRKGLVLVTVLWVAVLLGVMTAMITRSSRLDMKVSQVARYEGLRCKWASRAGIETVSAILNDDINGSDSLTDLWSDNPVDLNDVMLEGCRFTADVEDESGKLNINVITKEQLMMLPEMTEEIAEAILDWRDGNDEPTELGTESGYYENLPYGYKARNGNFVTVREFLLVKGVTEELFYGEDTNMNGKLDYNEQDGDASPPWDNGDDQLNRGWVPYLTCYSYDSNRDAEDNSKVDINRADQRSLERDLGISSGYAKWIVDNKPSNGYTCISDLISQSSKEKAGSGGNNAQALDLETFKSIADKITVERSSRLWGKVNVNTASSVVLKCLIGGDEDSAARVAQAIVRYRDSQTLGMESIAEVLNADGVDVDDFKKIAKYLTVRSNVYSIRSVATAERGPVDGATVVTEAIVDRSSMPCRILYWYQGVNN